MDPHFHGFLNPSNGLQFGNQFSKLPRFGITYPDQNEQKNQNYVVEDGNVPRSSADIDEDSDFSEGMLRYIDQMLMEDDMEDKTCMLKESLDLVAKEKSFYEVLGKKYPPSPQPESALISQYGETSDDFFDRNSSSIGCRSNGSGYLIDIVDPSWNSRISLSNSLSVVDGFSVSPVSPLQICDVYTESQPLWNFEKGVEEASKFRPAIYTDCDALSEEFDNVLLNSMGEGRKKFAAYRADPFDYLCSSYSSRCSRKFERATETDKTAFFPFG